jgi:hypothetical protein
MSCFTESTTRGTLILGCSNIKVFFIGILLRWTATVCGRISNGEQCNVYSWILPLLNVKLVDISVTRLRLNPIIAEDNEVYASYEFSQKNDEGVDVIGWTIERYVFNEAGDLVFSANLDESLFMAAQNGYFLAKN